MQAKGEPNALEFWEPLYTTIESDDSIGDLVGFQFTHVQKLEDLPTSRLDIMLRDRANGDATRVTSDAGSFTNYRYVMHIKHAYAPSQDYPWRLKLYPWGNDLQEVKTSPALLTTQLTAEWLRDLIKARLVTLAIKGEPCGEFFKDWA